MKKSYLMILAAAGAAIYLINKSGSAPAAIKNLAAGTTEILNSFGKQFETGWRYFSDGTTIDPFGNYWKGGQKIWSVPTTKQPISSTEAIFSPVTYDA